MSLIIDALNRAQQLRLANSEGSALSPPYPTPENGKKFKKQWIPIGVGLISLCIVLFLFLKPGSSPLATQTNRTVVPIQAKSSISVAENTSSELLEKTAPHDVKEDGLSSSSGQAWSPKNEVTRSEHPTNQESINTKTAPTDLSSQSKKEKKPVETRKDSRPSPLLRAPQKEDYPRRSVGVEQEGGKDAVLAAEVLSQFNSGVAFYNQKEFSKAIQTYQKVIALNPTFVEAYNNLGIIYQTIGDVDKAFGAFQKATEINPSYQKGYNNLGILLLVEGRCQEALQAFNKALDINPNNIESHINLGILFKKKGQWDEAIDSYKKALEIDPLHKETHYNIALLYEQLENLDLAISHYQKFIQLSSKSRPELVSKVRKHLNGLIEARKNKTP